MCFFLWLVTVLLLLLLQVSMGDEGLSQCAGKCDEAPGCVGYSMIESGLCSMMKAVNVSSVLGPSCCGLHVGVLARLLLCWCVAPLDPCHYV